jgi:hypothetical protein
MGLDHKWWLTTLSPTATRDWRGIEILYDDLWGNIVPVPIYAVPIYAFTSTSAQERNR